MIDQLLFEELTDGICITDAGGTPLYLNSAAARMLEQGAGAHDTSICEQLCGRFVSGNSEYPSACPLKVPGSTEKTALNMGRCRGMDLRVRCVRLATALFDSWEIEKHFTIIEDATAEMAAERLKEDWRNMIAHDLANPLTTIYGALKTLEEIPPGQPLEEGEINLIRMCTRTSQRMNETLTLFLQVARLDSGLMPTRPEILELLPLIRECVQEQAIAAADKSISIDLVLPESLRVRADRNLLVRVLQNLMSNAIKFTPGKGRITVSATTESDGGVVAVGIRDNGPGIASEDLPFMFDRFHQVRGKGDTLIRGNGLGLAFCKQAMKAMGGDIRVESALRFGTEFRVRLGRVA
ncbi:MAG: hypothetical protein HY923_10580 [Elusimicrobia bacterium]|nr:hypothetical protein [Elusimicrobiota bacterium]